MFTTQNSVDTILKEHLITENDQKRAAKTSDNTTRAKRAKLIDEEQSACPFASDSKLEWDLTPGNFLSQFLFPLLDSHNEKALLHWLKDINMFYEPKKCKCKRGKFVLNYETQFWVCEKCNKNFCIWSNSFFKYRGRSSKLNEVRNVNDALFCILAWCRKMPVNEASQTLQLNKQLVSNIYAKCATTVEACVADIYKNFAVPFGGVGSVVVIDLQLDGVEIIKNGVKTNRRHERAFCSLWIADTKYVPTRFWVQILPLSEQGQQLSDDCYQRFKFVSEDHLDKHFSLIQSPSVKREDVLHQNVADGDENFKAMKIYSPNTVAQNPFELRVLKEQQKMYDITQNQEVKVLKIDNLSKKAKGKDKGCWQIKTVEGPGIEKDKTFYDMEETTSNYETGPEAVAASLMKLSGEQENIRYTGRCGKMPSLSVEHRGLLQSELPTESPRQKKKNTIQDFGGEEIDQEACTEGVIESEPVCDVKLKNSRVSNFETTLLETVDRLIAPGSLVVANEEMIPNICSILRASKKYAAVESLSEILALDDLGHRPTSSIFDNLWKATNDVSKRLTTRTRKAASRIVSIVLWRQYFGSSLSDAAYHILHQISSHFDPSQPLQSAFYSEEFYF